MGELRDAGGAWFTLSQSQHLHSGMLLADWLASKASVDLDALLLPPIGSL